jgi:hypothetical protein
MITMRTAPHSLPALLLAMLLAIGPAAADADGPDTWEVTGVRADDVLNMHTEPSARSRTIAGIPPDAKGLGNRGCTGLPTFQQWSRMSEAERARSARARWCKVEFDGKTGWVAGRFLKEGTAVDPARKALTVGPWTIRCDRTCVFEQQGVGTRSPTLLRIDPREAPNAEITIERNGLPRRGTLAIYMDGETISEGPLAQLVDKSGRRIVMTPGDITLGLLKQMARHKNMVLAFPGEDRGVEIHLDRFEEALAEARKVR